MAPNRMRHARYDGKTDDTRRCDRIASRVGRARAHPRARAGETRRATRESLTVAASTLPSLYQFEREKRACIVGIETLYLWLVDHFHAITRLPAGKKRFGDAKRERER